MNKKGFTLAEVLITLGIIGIVAAITLPALISNIQGRQYKSRFLKTISTLNQAALKTFGDSGRDFITDFPDTIIYPQLSGAVDISNKYAINQDFGESSDKETVYNIDFSTLAIKTIPEDWNDAQAYMLSDGAVIYFITGSPCHMPKGGKASEALSGKYFESLSNYDMDNWIHVCIGFIDVNGIRKGPNKEVRCSNADTSETPETPCVVKNSDITDIFPIFYHDSTIEPSSNAAAYVLRNAK